MIGFAMIEHAQKQNCALLTVSDWSNQLVAAAVSGLKRILSIEPLHIYATSQRHFSHLGCQSSESFSEIAGNGFPSPETLKTCAME
ncbi:hypothetical protein ANAPC5_01443 [Anaplasma phagocytophilum]|nr:hypothetical protein ANAPC5_01443 [Anaplasma phagocytophilum]